MTTLILTDQEAALFVLWRKHQADFMLLVENRVFDLRNGSAELHFNPQGQIASIDLHAKVFRRISYPHDTVDKVKSMVS